MTTEGLEVIYEELAGRTRTALEQASGLTAPDTQKCSASEIDHAEQKRGHQFPADLRALYLAVGHGMFAYFEILEPLDEWSYDSEMREDLEFWREEGLFDDWTAEGDPAHPDSLVFAADGAVFFVYELGGARPGRIVTHVVGDCGRRKAWTASASLTDFLRCVTELCEAGAFEFQASTHERVPMAIHNQLVFDPEPFRDIFVRNNSTGSFYGSADFD